LLEKALYANNTADKINWFFMNLKLEDEIMAEPEDANETMGTIEAEPTNEDTEAECARKLRRLHNYNVQSLKIAVKKGLNLNVLRSYLNCLEKGADNSNWFSGILLKKYKFNTVFLSVAIKSGLDLAVLRKYLDYLEAKEH